MDEPKPKPNSPSLPTALLDELLDDERAQAAKDRAIGGEFKEASEALRKELSLRTGQHLFDWDPLVGEDASAPAPVDHEALRRRIEAQLPNGAALRPAASSQPGVAPASPRNHDSQRHAPNEAAPSPAGVGGEGTYAGGRTRAATGDEPVRDGRTRALWIGLTLALLLGGVSLAWALSNQHATTTSASAAAGATSPENTGGPATSVATPILSLSTNETAHPSSVPSATTSVPVVSTNVSAVSPVSATSTRTSSPSANPAAATAARPSATAPATSPATTVSTKPTSDPPPYFERSPR